MVDPSWVLARRVDVNLGQTKEAPFEEGDPFLVEDRQDPLVLVGPSFLV